MCFRKAASSKNVRVGSPTFVTNGEIFWSDDRLEDAIRWHSDESTAALEV